MDERVAELELELEEYGVDTSATGLAQELRLIVERWRAGEYVHDGDDDLEPSIAYGAAVLELAAITLEEVLS